MYVSTGPSQSWTVLCPSPWTSRRWWTINQAFIAMLVTGMPSTAVLSLTRVLAMSISGVNQCATLVKETLFLKPCHHNPVEHRQWMTFFFFFLCCIAIRLLSIFVNVDVSESAKCHCGDKVARFQEDWIHLGHGRCFVFPACKSDGASLYTFPFSVIWCRGKTWPYLLNLFLFCLTHSLIHQNTTVVKDPPLVYRSA